MVGHVVSVDRASQLRKQADVSQELDVRTEQPPQTERCRDFAGPDEDEQVCLCQRQWEAAVDGDRLPHFEDARKFLSRFFIQRDHAQAGAQEHMQTGEPL